MLIELPGSKGERFFVSEGNVKAVVPSSSLAGHSEISLWNHNNKVLHIALPVEEVLKKVPVTKQA